MRTFISFELPEEVKAEIFKRFDNLKNSGIVIGNFVEKENLHLTLKFLGNISEEELNKIQEKLSEIDFPNFEIETGEIGFFPSNEYVKIIWVGLNSDNILKLKKIIDDKMGEIGLPLDNKKFSSHITVARIKKMKNKDEFLKRINDLNFKKYKFKANNFSLIKSELMRDGPIYKLIKKFDFKIS